MADFQWIKEKRWFSQKGLDTRIDVIDSLPLDGFKWKVLRVSSASIDEIYSLPLYDGMEADGSVEFINEMISRLNRNLHSGEFKFHGIKTLGQIEDAKLMDLGTSNVLVRADGMIMKSYRHLRRGNIEPYILQSLAASGFAPIPEIYGFTTWKDMPVYAIMKHISDGIEAGVPVYKAMTEKKHSTIPADVAHLLRDMHTHLRHIHLEIVDDFLEYERWREEMVRRLRQRVDFLSHHIRDFDPHTCEDYILSSLDTYNIQITHGDFHLSQVLHSPDGMYIIDFEGEPEYDYPPVFPPERDVASLLRSLDYIWRIGSMSGIITQDEGMEWYRWHEKEVLAAYGISRERVLSWLIEKALYEVEYELRNRPDMAGIPLDGLREIMGEMK